MSDQNTTPESVQDSLIAALAAAGFEMGTPRTRTNIGRDILATLEKVGSMGIVMGKEAKEVDVSRVAEVAAKLNVTAIRESEKSLASVKSNVQNAASKRKMGIGMTAFKSDVSGRTIGFYVVRKPYVAPAE
jgi:hypothetical protein